MELACSAPWIPSLIVFEISKEPVNKTDLSINYAMLMPQVILPRNLTFQLINLIPQVGFPIKCFFFRYFRKNINGFRLPTVKIYQHIYSFFDFSVSLFLRCILIRAIACLITWTNIAWCSLETYHESHRYEFFRRGLYCLCFLKYVDSGIQFDNRK